MNNPEKIKKILLSEIEDMNQHRENFCRRPGIDFTRDRKIPFDTLLHFQISMESGCVSHELLKYFSFDAAAPSLSAFFQQRAKLSDEVFQKLFYSFNNPFKPKALLKGRRQLLGVTGRPLLLPGPRKLLQPQRALCKRLQPNVPRPVV